MVSSFIYKWIDPCDLKVREGTLFIHGSSLLPENDGQVYSFQNGTEVEVACKNGYKIKGMDTTGADDYKRYTTCDTGKWTHDYYCIPGIDIVRSVLNIICTYIFWNICLYVLCF